MPSPGVSVLARPSPLQRLAAEKSRREAEAKQNSVRPDGTPVTLESVQLEVAKAHNSLLSDQAEWEKWRSRAQMLRAYARKRQQGLVEGGGEEGEAAAAIMRLTGVGGAGGGLGAGGVHSARGRGGVAQIIAWSHTRLRSQFQTLQLFSVVPIATRASSRPSF